MHGWVHAARPPPGWELGARGRGGEQCDGGKPNVRLVRAHGQTADRWHPQPSGAGMSDRVLAGALQRGSRTWCNATTARTFPGQTTRWNAASVDGSTRYRRISGRKNWNAYLVRYGRSVAYYEWWEQDATRRQQLVELASKLDHARWRELRHETTVAQHEQLTRFRFRHQRQAFLASLEERWAAAAPSHSLP
jgi:hypothetical protein